MRQEDFNLLDKILDHFYIHRMDNVIVHNIWPSFCKTDKEFYLLINDLYAEGLIYKSSTKTYSNPAMNLYQITSAGIKVFEGGGIANLFALHNESLEKYQVKEQMEYQKLANEIFDLNNKLQGYPLLKKQAFWGILIAGASLIVAIIALFKK